MNIDPAVNNVLLNNAESLVEPNKKADTDNTASKAVDSTLSSEYSSVIARAIESDQVDLESVEKARQDLESGLLDTPQNADQAAENILKFGI